MTDSRPNMMPRFLVVGEMWERAIVQRSADALRAAGLTVSTFRFRYNAHSRPLRYGEVLGRLIDEHPEDEFFVVVPAGFVPGKGLGQTFDALLAQHSFATGSEVTGSEVTGSEVNASLQTLDVSEAQRQVLAVRSSDSQDDLVVDPQLSAHLATHFTDLVPRDLADSTVGVVDFPEKYEKRKPVILRLGRHVFQTLQSNHSCPTSLEEPARILSSDAFGAEPNDAIYKWNTEILVADLDIHSGHDVLLSVASGLKPWKLAHELRHSLQHLVLIDSNYSQLHFARLVYRSKGAETWDEVADNPGYRSISPNQRRREHNQVFELVQRHRHEWRFDVTFIQADLMTQTFSLCRLLNEIPAERPFFWYSNAFIPHLGDFSSEHHKGIEESFCRLMLEVYPDLTVLDWSKHPTRLPSDWDTRFPSDARAF